MAIIAQKNVDLDDFVGAISSRFVLIIFALNITVVILRHKGENRHHPPVYYDRENLSM